MEFKISVISFIVLLCTACSATNPVKDLSIESTTTVKEVLTTPNKAHFVRWGGEVLDIQFHGQNSLILLGITEQKEYKRPEPANKTNDKLQVVVFTPNLDANKEYRTGDLITLIGNAKKVQTEAESGAVIVFPDAIYSWLDIRDNRTYDPTGIIAMSNIDNQYLIRFKDAPWENQDETDPMLQREPIYTLPNKKSKNLVLFEKKFK